MVPQSMANGAWRPIAWNSVRVCVAKSMHGSLDLCRYQLTLRAVTINAAAHIKHRCSEILLTVTCLAW